MKELLEAVYLEAKYQQQLETLISAVEYTREDARDTRITMLKAQAEIDSMSPEEFASLHPLEQMSLRMRADGMVKGEIEDALAEGEYVATFVPHRREAPLTSKAMRHGGRASATSSASVHDETTDDEPSEPKPPITGYLVYVSVDDWEAGEILDYPITRAFNTLPEAEDALETLASTAEDKLVEEAEKINRGSKKGSFTGEGGMTLSAVIYRLHRPALMPDGDGDGDGDGFTEAEIVRDESRVCTISGANYRLTKSGRPRYTIDLNELNELNDFWTGSQVAPIVARAEAADDCNAAPGSSHNTTAGEQTRNEVDLGSVNAVAPAKGIYTLMWHDHHPRYKNDVWLFSIYPPLPGTFCVRIELREPKYYMYVGNIHGQRARSDVLAEWFYINEPEDAPLKAGWIPQEEREFIRMGYTKVLSSALMKRMWEAFKNGRECK